jgi:predicted dithiol-disulfide oxidoreductase (DUF899 family)
MRLRVVEAFLAESPNRRHFPNESKEYRAAREDLLTAERELRRQVERVAAQRRTLPLGGKVPEDYVFDEEIDGRTRNVKLSELFGPHSTLIAYSYMFPAQRDGSKPCPMCTSMLDGLDGQAKHVTQQASLVVVAKIPIEQLTAFARERGWRSLRLLSSAHNRYNADYHGEAKDGSQLPMLNVFTRRDGTISHRWASELFFARNEQGEHPRHIDAIWPLWNVLDLTPEGRGKDWLPKLAY